MQPGSHEKQDNPSLDRPENAADWRADGLGSHFHRDWPGLQEVFARRRLNVGKEVLVGSEAIQQLRVRVDLSLRHPLPSSVVDQRLYQPCQEGNCGRDHQETRPSPSIVDRHISMAWLFGSSFGIERPGLPTK